MGVRFDSDEGRCAGVGGDSGGDRVQADVTAPVRNRETVVMTVAVLGLAEIGAACGRIRAVGRAARQRGGAVLLVDDLAVLGAGGVPNEQVVGDAGELAEKTECRDETGQTPDSALSRPISQRA